MDQTPSLTDKVTELATAKQRQDELQAQYDAAKVAFEATHKQLLDDLAAAKQTTSTLDTEVRELALASGEKKPHDAVEIKTWDECEFDPTEAVNWCRLYMPALLELNTKAYDKVLREVVNSKTLSGILTMPGKVVEKPKASVARDLTAYLPTPVEKPAPVKGITPREAQRLAEQTPHCKQCGVLHDVLRDGLCPACQSDLVPNEV
jgi:hypothetical protein